MNRLAVILLLAIPAFSQTNPQAPLRAVPDSPPCLSAPVVKGTITLSCSAVDGTRNGKDGTDAVPSDAASLGFYVFQVRISSSDPDVVAVLVKLTLWQGDNPQRQRVVAISPSPSKGTFAYTFALEAGVSVDLHESTPPIVSAITVQELRAGSSQSF